MFVGERDDEIDATDDRAPCTCGAVDLDLDLHVRFQRGSRGVSCDLGLLSLPAERCEIEHRGSMGRDQRSRVYRRGFIVVMRGGG